MDHSKMTKQTIVSCPDFEGEIQEVIERLESYLPSEDEVEAGVVVRVDEVYDYDDVKQYRIVRYTPMTPEELKFEEELQKERDKKMRAYKEQQLERLKKELGVE